MPLRLCVERFIPLLRVPLFSSDSSEFWLRFLAAHHGLLCPDCEYPLDHRDSDRCPECGHIASSDAARAAWIDAGLYEAKTGPLPDSKS